MCHPRARLKWHFLKEKNKNSCDDKHIKHPFVMPYYIFHVKYLTHLKYILLEKTRLDLSF